MDNSTSPDGKMKCAHIEAYTHERIMALSKILRSQTHSPHPAYVVIRMAVTALENTLGIGAEGSFEDGK